MTDQEFYIASTLIAAATVEELQSTVDLIDAGTFKAIPGLYSMLVVELSRRELTL